MSSFKQIPNLESQHVHIWLIPLLQDESVVSSCYGVMNEAEKQRSQKNHNPQHYVVAHGALRQILSQYLSVPPQEVVFTHSKFHKPYLDPNYNPYQIEFNLSHSQDMALCGVTTTKRIGVDIEYKRPLKDLLGLAQTVLTPEEYDFFSHQDKQKLGEIFFKYWTAKEAFIKGVGEGFHFGLDNISFSANLEDVHDFNLFIKSFPNESKEWSVRSFCFDPSYAGAVATKQPIRTLERFMWAPVTDVGQ